MKSEVIQIFERILKNSEELQKLLKINTLEEVYKLFEENGYSQSFENFEKEMITLLKKSGLISQEGSVISSASEEYLSQIAGGNAMKFVKKAVASALVLMGISSSVPGSAVYTSPRSISTTISKDFKSAQNSVSKNYSSLFKLTPRQKSLLKKFGIPTATVGSIATVGLTMYAISKRISKIQSEVDGGLSEIGQTNMIEKTKEESSNGLEEADEKMYESLEKELELLRKKRDIVKICISGSEVYFDNRVSEAERYLRKAKDSNLSSSVRRKNCSDAEKFIQDLQKSINLSYESITTDVATRIWMALPRSYGFNFNKKDGFKFWDNVRNLCTNYIYLHKDLMSAMSKYGANMGQCGVDGICKLSEEWNAKFSSIGNMGWLLCSCREKAEKDTAIFNCECRMIRANVNELIEDTKKNPYNFDRINAIINQKEKLIKKLNAKIPQLEVGSSEMFKAELARKNAEKILKSAKSLIEVNAANEECIPEMKLKMEELCNEAMRYKSATQGVMNLLESIIKFESAYRLYTMEQ